MERNLYLDFLKGILICLVTIGHADQFVVLQCHDYLSNPLFRSIYMFHMPLFIGVSGYLSFSGITASNNTIEYVKSKTISFLVPIFAWAAISKTLEYFFTPAEPIAGLPKIIIKEFATSLWFLWALWGCLVITASLHSIRHHFKTFYFLSFFAVLMLPDKGHITMLKFMYPYFQIGFLLASGALSFEAFRSSFVFVAALFISVVCFYLWNDDSYIYTSKMSLSAANLHNIFIRYVAGFAASIVIVNALFLVFKLLSNQVLKWIAVLGINSIYIYIIQGYCFDSIFHFLRTFYSPIQNLVVGALLSVIIGILIAVISLMIGNVIAMNTLLAKFLFGKSRRSAVR